MSITPLDGDGQFINNSLGPDVTESQCKSESICSQNKRKNNNKGPQFEQNGQIDCQGGGSLMNDNSTGTNSCDGCIVNTNTKADLKIAPPVLESSWSQEKRMRKEQKLITTVVNDSSVNPSNDLNKKRDNGGSSIFETPVLIDAMADSPISPFSELIQSQEKMKKNRKLNATDINNEAPVPPSEMDSIEVEANALIFDNQNDSSISPTSLVKEHDNNVDVKVSTDCRKICNSSGHEEIAEPIMVTRQTSANSNEVYSSELTENEIEIVQSGECATSIMVVENVSSEKTSSNCSSGDLPCVGGKEITEKEKKVDLECPPKEGNLSQVSLSTLQLPCVGDTDKKLLILDVNGLLADIVPYCSDVYKADIVISRKSVFKRPFCDDFLQFCFEKFNVGVWSSRTKKNVDMVIDFLMGDSRHKLLFCWHQSHCTDTGFTTVENNHKPLVLKELKKLWDKLEPDLPWNKGEYNESNTLLLDDSPYKALRNPAHTAIFPHSYRYKNAGDTSLGPGGDLRVYLERLAEAQNVREFVAENPFGQRAITESNPSWGFYERILIADSWQSSDVASSCATGK